MLVSEYYRILSIKHNIYRYILSTTIGKLWRFLFLCAVSNILSKTLRTHYEKIFINVKIQDGGEGGMPISEYLR